MDGENKKQEKTLYVLTYISVNNSFDSELFSPYANPDIYDDYYKAIGHLTESFSDTLDRLKKDAFFNNKEQPKFEQKCDRAWIKYDGKYERWEIDRVPVK